MLRAPLAVAAIGLALTACIAAPSGAPTSSPTATLPANSGIVEQISVALPGQQPWRVMRFATSLIVITQAITGAGAVLRYDARNGRRDGPVLRLDFGPGEAAYGFGSLWIARARGDGSLVRVDPKRLSIIAQVGAGHNLGPGVTAAFGSVWTANQDPSAPPGPGSGSVSRIDPVSNQVVQTIPSGPSPLTISAGEGALWTANHGDESVSRIDPQGARLVATIPSSGIHNVMTAAGAAWVASYHTQALLVISLATDRVTRRIALPFAPQAMTVFADELYVASAGYGVLRERAGRVAIITGSSNAVRRTIDIGAAVQSVISGEGEVWLVCDRPAVAVRLRTG